MKIELKDLEVGDSVWCGGDSGFTTDSIEKVVDITFQFDETTGKKYKVIWLSGNRKFDSMDGNAMTPPTMYYIQPTEQP